VVPVAVMGRRKRRRRVVCWKMATRVGILARHVWLGLGGGACAGRLSRVGLLCRGLGGGGGGGVVR
jgi:hypothetical protein